MSGVSKSTKQKKAGKDIKTKIVIRRLPPSLPEDLFRKVVSPWVNFDTAVWTVFRPGSVSDNTTRVKEAIFSRAYVTFKQPEDLIKFHKSFDGHLFVDNKGNQYQAVVEYAPFQLTPKNRKKPDSRQDTIEADPDYQEFMSALEQKVKSTESQSISEAKTYLDPTIGEQKQEMPKTTPLLEFLKAKKQEQTMKYRIMAPPSREKSSASKSLTPTPSIASSKSGRKRERDRKRRKDKKSGSPAREGKREDERKSKLDVKKPTFQENEDKESSTSNRKKPIRDIYRPPLSRDTANETYKKKGVSQITSSTTTPEPPKITLLKRPTSEASLVNKSSDSIDSNRIKDSMNDMARTATKESTKTNFESSPRREGKGSFRGRNSNRSRRGG